MQVDELKLEIKFDFFGEKLGRLKRKNFLSVGVPFPQAYKR